MAVCPTLRWPLGVYYRDLYRLGSPLADHQTSFTQLALGYKIVDALFEYLFSFLSWSPSFRSDPSLLHFLLSVGCQKAAGLLLLVYPSFILFYSL